MRSHLARVLLAGVAFCLAWPAMAEPVLRSQPAAGAVIARKSGEEVRFVDISNWQYVDLQQNLLAGDVLRTNATGQLAVLFSDRTQVRLARNTSLLVKNMNGGSAETGLELQSGTIWARAERGGQGLAVDTPAATAAIRGTDWTLTVDASGKTSLIVLEGLVELKNAQGSVQVAQGEAAVASIGQAPQKVVIVDPKDREQMLFYLQLRDSFGWMPASPLSVRGMSAEKQRIEATAPQTRSAEDWLTLAEIDMSLNGRSNAEAALAEAETRGLTAGQRARAALISGLIAGSERRYDDAAKLFKLAVPGLDPQRRTIAQYGGYYARSLRDPNRVEQPPASYAGPYGALAEAWTAGFLKDIKAAVDILKKAEQRFPDDATLPAARAQFALLIDDREQVMDASNRALSLDPTHPMALEARAHYKAGYEADLKGAIADLNAALVVAPGSTSAWNSLGLALSAIGDNRKAEEALKTSIALDPRDPVSHINLSILYLDQGRVKEAKKEIDTAMAADPSFDLALIARGRYYMQTGEMDKAMSDLLAGSTANPGYSQAQLMLAAVHYETGNRDAAAQAIDNADRLDANDPVVSSVRTAIAIDDYDAAGAIRYAQEFLRRARARGGYYGALSANQDAGSTLNNAFRLQGLDAWGQYYGDVVFDPFAGSSYIDQTLRGSPNPYSNTFGYEDNTAAYSDNSASFSSFMQGLMLDPHMLTGRSRTANLLRRPFLEGSIGGTLTRPDGEGKDGRVKEAELQGYSNTPFPVSFYGTARFETNPDTRVFEGLPGGFVSETDIRSGTAYISASPTPDDHVVGFFSRNKSEQNVVTPLLLGDILAGASSSYNQDSTNAGIAWSHSFGYRNNLNAAVFYGDIKKDSREIGVFGDFPLGENYGLDTQKNLVGAINHTVGDDDLTWRYGVEGGRIDAHWQRLAITYTPPSLTPTDVTFNDVEDEITVGRAYVDALYEATPDLKFEGALFGRYLDGDTVQVSRLEPRAGVAWSPAEGHWLRAGILREGFDLNIPTLAPIGMVGMQSNQQQLGFNGYTDTFAARWEAEWNDRFFTAVDVQHQQMHNLSIDIPLTTNTIDLNRGRIDRVSVTANLALDYGFGISATAVYADSENQDRDSFGYGRGLPYVPEKAAQVALTWVNTNNVKTTLAANYTGKRQGDDLGTELDGYWTVDAKLEWEPLDKRFAVNLAVYNLLDEDFLVSTFIPGWGRTYMGSLKVRF
ncbi:TonB-dependent receptor [Metarhizobium album]|uniref:TonB-dependent receptor n=1 Tax=Metarhizobium album TaxID=2182425 RepID=A0A2U2DR32_9HYPH|nr:TonB-dependent receptor [Rhizobium album]